MTDYGQVLTFGVFLTPQAADPQFPVALAQHSEAAGIDLVTFQDHPYQPAFLDTWTLMSWVAACTTRVEVAANVHNLPLRAPAVLARAGASLDLLSGGRFAMALGAGAFWDAIVAMGGPRRTGGQALAALDEAISVIRALWDTSEQGMVRVPGEYYALAGAKRGPAPAHRVPIWVGGLGPRMLALIGRRADGWLPSLSRMAPGDLARGNALVDDAARAVGRDPADIRRLVNIGWPPGVDLAPDGVARPALEAWVGELVRLAVADGVGTFILATDDPRQIEVFGGQVAPLVRARVADAR